MNRLIFLTSLYKTDMAPTAYRIKAHFQQKLWPLLILISSPPCCSCTNLQQHVPTLQAWSNLSALPTSQTTAPVPRSFPQGPFFPSQADHGWWLLTNVTPGSHSCRFKFRGLGWGSVILSEATGAHARLGVETTFPWHACLFLGCSLFYHYDTNSLYALPAFF